MKIYCIFSVSFVFEIISPMDFRRLTTCGVLQLICSTWPNLLRQHAGWIYASLSKSGFSFFIFLIYAFIIFCSRPTLNCFGKSVLTDMGCVA